MSLIELTEENFKAEVLDFEGKVIVDFYAEWCGPCKMMGPIFENAAEMAKGSAKFAKLNVDSANKVAAEYGVMSIPTLIVFKNGEKVNQMVGVQDADTLVKIAKEV